MTEKALNVYLPIDGTSGNRDLEEIVAKVMLEYFELWKEKQHAYGPENIAEFADMGCLIRGTDKLKRLRRYYMEGQNITIGKEGVVDSWLDLLGYALMGLVCFRGQWPGQIIFGKNKEGIR